MNCPRCASVAPADASSCPGCGAALTQTCEECGRSSPSEAAFCAGCGHRLAAAPAPATTPAAEPSGERRTLTVLFSDVSGYTAMNERLDPEEVAEIMNEIKREASQSVEAYGGLVNQFVGDEVMALFGLPNAAGDDPRRAVAAALELHERVRDIGHRMGGRLERPLRMHSGIHTGLVIAQLRDRRDGVYGVTGDTVNTASRLLHLARADEVWVGPETHALIRDFFETEATGAHPVKGKVAPVEAHRVLGRRAVGTRFEAAVARGLTPRIGRATELGQLEAALARAAGGRGQLVTIVGEAGIGKSRLAHEFRAGIDPELAAVFEGRAQAFGSSTPYLPFLQALHAGLGLGENDTAEAVIARAVETLPAIDPGLERYIPVYLQLLSTPSAAHPLPPELGGEALPGAIRDAVVALNVALSKTRTLVLVFEDWHWADEASDAVLQQLAAAVAEHRVLIVVLHRPQLEPDWPDLKFEEIRLLPFDRGSTAALVAHCLGAARVDDALVDQIDDRTLGNPFFVEEVCVALSGSDALERDGESVRLARELTELELPESVQAVLRSRMDRLEPQARETLRLASVIGCEFSGDLLAQVAPTGWPTQARLDDLIRQDFVQRQPDAGTDAYRFKHVTTQEVAYDGLLRRRRAEIHRRVAAAIRRLDREGRLEEHYEALANHYLAAGDDEDAIRFLELAARKAERSCAMHQARAHYQRAIERSQVLGDSEALARRRVDLFLHYAATCPFGPSLEQIPLLELGVEEAQRLGDQAAALRVRYWICWVLYAVGDHRRAIQETQRTVDVIRPLGNDGTTGSFVCHLGGCYVIARDFAQAEALLAEGIEMRRRHSAEKGTNLGGTTAYAAAQYALVLADRGDKDDADRFLALALETVQEIGQRQTESSVRITIGLVAALRRGWKEALEAAQAARAPAQDMLAPYHLATCDSIEGQARFHLGEHEAGIALLRRGLAGIQRCKLPMTLTWSLACLAEALAHVGAWDEAERLAQEALARGPLLDRLGEDVAERTRLRIAVHRDPACLAREASALLARCEAHGSPRERALAEACVRELGG